jgi:hypothetical protein
MRRTPKRAALPAAVLLLTLALAAASFAQWKLRGKGRDRELTPRNDIPAVSHIGWRPHQDALRVDRLKVDYVAGSLNLYNDRLLFRFVVTGMLAHDMRSWRPYIKEVHISERFLDRKPGEHPVADILITPIVGVKEDPDYAGQQVPLKLNVEHVLHTFQWGTNRYVIRCAGHEQAQEVFHHK